MASKKPKAWKISTYDGFLGDVYIGTVFTTDKGYKVKAANPHFWPLTKKMEVVMNQAYSREERNEVAVESLIREFPTVTFTKSV